MIQLIQSCLMFTDNSSIITNLKILEEDGSKTDNEDYVKYIKVNYRSNLIT